MSKRKVNKLKQKGFAQRSFKDLTRMGVLRGQLKRGEITFDQVPPEFKKVEDLKLSDLELREDLAQLELKAGIEAAMAEEREKLDFLPNEDLLPDDEEHVHGDSCHHG